MGHEKGGLKVPILAGRPLWMAPKQLWKRKQERNTLDFISTFGPNAQRLYLRNDNSHTMIA